MCSDLCGLSLSQYCSPPLTALHTWASLCKCFPGQICQDPLLEAHNSPTTISWSSCLSDFRFLFKGDNLDFVRLYSRHDKKVTALKPVDSSTGPVLYSLLVGADGNEQASSIYSNMMDYAQNRGGFHVHASCTYNIWLLVYMCMSIPCVHVGVV